MLSCAKGNDRIRMVKGFEIVYDLNYLITSDVT